jgi:hypothetical protein
MAEEMHIFIESITPAAVSLRYNHGGPVKIILSREDFDRWALRKLLLCTEAEFGRLLDLRAK